MPSESVASFLESIQANRVLFPDQVEQLIRAPDIPQAGLTDLCRYLHDRRVLTPFQAAAIREARSDDLNYAGYPVLDELGPCPGGTAYKVLHPSLRTPLVLRRVRASWLAPTDNPMDYVARARTFGMLAHPHVVPLLDAGVHPDEVYLVIDPPKESADIETLAREVGAMPGFLAAEYGRAIASALRMAHERGGVHGDVRPANVFVGPLHTKTGEDGTTRRRPAPDAVVRLAELGLVPVRPALTPTPYLAPEQSGNGPPNARGDIYGLGVTLYFMLTGRPPFTADNPTELLNLIRAAEPASLASLRPDLPAGLVELIGKMLAKQPDLRPPTAADVESALLAFCRPEMVPQQAAPDVISHSTISIHPVDPAATEAPPPEPTDGWGVGEDAFSYTSAAKAAPRKREFTPEQKARKRLLLIVGGLLHLIAAAMLVAWLTGMFDRAPDTNTPEPKTPKQAVPKTKSKNPT